MGAGPFEAWLKRHGLRSTKVWQPRGATFAEGSESVSEDVGAHEVKITLDSAPASAISLGYEVSGTATAGVPTQLSGAVKVPAGTTSLNIPVVIINDNVQEEDETAMLTVTTSVTYDRGIKRVMLSSYILTITDDDTAGVGIRGREDGTVVSEAAGVDKVIATGWIGQRAHG